MSVQSKSFMSKLWGNIGPGSRKALNSLMELDLSCPPVAIHSNSELEDSAVLSGQLLLNVKVQGLRVKTVSVHLDQVAVSTRPAVKKCPDCRERRIELKTWSLLESPKSLTEGAKHLSFSENLPSNLPPSVSAQTAQVYYELRAIAVVETSGNEEVKTLEITTDRKVQFYQASPKPHLPAYISKTFPTSGIEFCTLLDSISSTCPSKISIDIDGLQCGLGDGYSWSIVRAEWMLKELVETYTQACERHADQASSAPEEQTPHIKKNRVAGAQLFDGWRIMESDNSALLDFTIDLGSRRPRKSPIACSYSSTEYGGLKIRHELTVELSIMMERHRVGDQDGPTKVGVARILTERYPVHLVDHTEGGHPPGYSEDQ